MITNNILKMLSTAAAVAQNVNKSLKEKGQEIIEDNILKGKYITREEHANLQARLDKLQQEIKVMKINKETN